MAEDKEEFLYPKIDADKCIRCNKCLKVCPFKNSAGDTTGIQDIETEVYAACLKDKKELAKSSSGGGYTALSDCFLNNDFAIISAVYNYQTHTEEYSLVRSRDERDAARGSKYVESKPGDIFKVAEKWLQDNPEKELLFVGMGCQAEGFRKFAEVSGLRNRVYVVDIICHGSPSSRLWKEYAKSLERKHNGKITYLTFRDKRNGWTVPTAYCTINDKEVRIADYVNIFYSRCAYRPSCHVCPFDTTERKVDITIGDFWHIDKTIPDFYDEAGISVFLLHTNRGRELFDKIRPTIDYRKSNTTECWQLNLESPTPVSPNRDEFWKDYHDKGINYISKKYGSISMKLKIKKMIKRLLRRI